VIELLGDSARGSEFALVRLTFDGDRIVEADASGLERSLVGLTLLEAAAVPGETLAADALANAIGPVFRAPHSPGRTAVAMSGGVDSAVALLRSLPNAIGVTLRLWLDPDGPDAERVCCSPEAVIAARETCHALGIPHVTLDLR
jgi:tRNA-specific 2-thiouridylase